MAEAAGLTGAVLLLVGAAFSVVVWPAFLRRVARDERARDAQGRPTRFLTVHVTLVAIAIVLAIAQAVAGIWWLLAR
ncbi:SCO4848 family membrane protein [Agrococcus sediminis]|uniref:SCO4848 family membrane protein n=1 Tax=Agrococcus sediminis TaxID=2599924 RepID=UPI00381BF475